jgi:hypothetical protein
LISTGIQSHLLRNISTGIRLAIAGSWNCRIIGKRR